jgi:hypothetical protein
MAVYDQHRKALWESLLEADYNKRYWQSKANDYAFRDRVLQIMLAISSSAALFTLLSEFGGVQVWKVLSFITAIIAVAMPFLNLCRRSLEMKEVSNLWHELELGYDQLWRTCDLANYSNTQFQKLKNRELGIGKKIFDLPINDKKLQEVCYEQVLVSRGQTNAGSTD